MARAAILCAVMADLTRGAQIVSLGSGPIGLLRTPRGNATDSAMQPGARSTSYCGSTAGTLPSLISGAAQVGCAYGTIVIPQVDFTLNVPTSDDDFGFCVANGAACTQPYYSDRTPCLFRGFSTGAGNWKLSQPCGGSTTCCVIVTCENIFSSSCTSRASYTAYFVGTLGPGGIAGVVLGTIGAALLCVCVCLACRRRRAAGGDVVYSAIAPQFYQPTTASQGAYDQQAYSTTPHYNQASYQQQGAYDQQPLKGAQPVYQGQGGTYQGGPPQPSYQQPAYPGAQSVPTWGSAPPRL
jgi:hypothetical protein